VIDVSMVDVSNPVFVFASDKLFHAKPWNKMREVEPWTIRVHHVKRVPVGCGEYGSQTWDFQIVGDETATWYRTHYDWALVLDVKENHAIHERIVALEAAREEIQQNIRERYAMLIRVDGRPE
jgi:hypothetical protein